MIQFITQDLTHHNSFGIKVKAEKLYKIYSPKDILVFLSEHIGPYKILGGGSNILFTGDIATPLLKNEIKGTEIIDEDHEYCMVRVGGGEHWHDFVMWSVRHRLGGLENLALIPGTVGAAPIQNIGAYGIEQKDYMHSVDVIDMESGLLKTFYKDDCKFGYRDSIFKGQARDQYFITHVTYLLHKNHIPEIKYPDVSNALQDAGITNPSPEQVAETVIAIRQHKLPDPKILGNAGSFFKNPIIDRGLYTAISQSHPNMPNYPQEDGVKLSAAWLIDQSGFKGIKVGRTGTHERQALVIVNNGGASGDEIVNFAVEVQQKVYEVFGVELEPEVNIW